MKMCRLFTDDGFKTKRLVFKEGVEAKGEAGPAKPSETGKDEPVDKLNPKEEEQAKSKIDEMKKGPKAKGKLAEAQKAFKEKYEQLKKLDDKEVNVEEKRRECVRFLRVALQSGLEAALQQQEQLSVLHNPEELKALQSYLLKDGLNAALGVDRSLTDWRLREGHFLYTNSSNPAFVEKWNSSVDQSQRINVAIQRVYKLRDAKSENAQEWFDAYMGLRAAVGDAQVSYAKLDGAGEKKADAGKKPETPKKPEAAPAKPPVKKPEAPPAKPPVKKPEAAPAKPPVKKPEAAPVKPPVKKPEAPKKPDAVAAQPPAKKPEAPKKPDAVAAQPPAKKPEAPKKPDAVAVKPPAKKPEAPKKPDAVAVKAPEKPKPGEPKVDKEGKKYFDSYDNLKVYLTNQFGRDGMRDLNRRLGINADSIARSVLASDAPNDGQVNVPVKLNVEGQLVAFTMEIPKAKANINKLANRADLYKISGIKFVLREAKPDIVLPDQQIGA
ncbi:hypothetical protein IT413_02590 [Candidatus Peregrinibacteria bacterium]|nr:hypothetical protein [Candidatus Peregrinibacteria bacterium]